ncbi:hypothetical protein BROUX41_003028 [Berkeleyomyces rouxiae]|uniref:uncharacterized protein n=1 Tax=Berkeleyomyces rouxiae TaxID=2035830 RepID=UPI003B7DB3CC
MSSAQETVKKPQPVGSRAIRPSSSVVLVSPANQVLLLHRVQTSTSFPSAHVFPGGNIDPKQDGQLPEDPIQAHQDSPVYRLAAIRECFEESGILLAKRKADGRVVRLPAPTLEETRHQIHQQKLGFTQWLAQIEAYADVDGLVPFTRWVTPAGVKRRFTTQMYVYFMPLLTSVDEAHDIPTSDGGLEHTEVRFDDSSSWLETASSGKIMLFPPQVYLLSHVATYLPGVKGINSASKAKALQEQRDNLVAFLQRPQDGDDVCARTSWAEKVISPTAAGKCADGRIIMTLEHPGPELKAAGRHGDRERVVIGKFTKDGVSAVEVRMRNDVALSLKL